MALVTARWPSGGFCPHPPYPAESGKAGLPLNVVRASSGKRTEISVDFLPLAIPSRPLGECYPYGHSLFWYGSLLSDREQWNQAGGSSGAQQSQKHLWPRWLSWYSNGLENGPLGTTSLLSLPTTPLVGCTLLHDDLTLNPRPGCHPETSSLSCCCCCGHRPVCANAMQRSREALICQP